MLNSPKEDVFDVMDARKINELSLTSDFNEDDPRWMEKDREILSAALQQVREKEYEQLFFYHDRFARLRLIIAIHNTKAGPALGGCRISKYSSFAEHLADAIGKPGSEGLASNMTKKSLIAGLPYGGGKAVIDADPANPQTKNHAFFAALARALRAINQDKLIYIMGEDSGVNEQDIEILASLTDGKYVAGRPRTVHKGNFKGSGDPGLITAFGVIRGMKAACNFLEMGDWFHDKIVAIQGLGSVGENLARELIKRYPGVRIIASDVKCDPESTHPDRELLIAMCKSLGIELVHSNRIYFQKCDIFSPCALRVNLNETNIPHLRCLIVAGAQNNQLATTENAYHLFKKGIVYVPDYVINAGGLVNVADELQEDGYNYTRVVYGRVWQIYDRVLEILNRSREEQVPPHVIADTMAQEKLAALS